jgi:asparagine synthase (glutamine-hydrolysing)
MCGIAGFADTSFNYTEENLRTIVDSISYRGPDDAGYLIIDGNYERFGLGHRRLSIIDLSPLGHQPMVYEDFTIVFNGEIYNYRDIRSELKKEGYTFFSESDTEVILKAFHRWGTDSISKFNGMFAFAIYNKSTDELILVRDRIGVKPLYYYQFENIFAFASELKPLINLKGFNKEIDQEALQLFLGNGYITAPHSIFKYVKKVLPGSIIKYKNGKLSLETYWSVSEKFSQAKKRENITEEEALASLDDLITDSVRLRMISDVPIGCFLSGGYDSSLVAAVMQKQSSTPINTFTIGFDVKAFDEAPHAKKVAKAIGSNHHELYLPLKRAEELIPQIPDFFDEPFADFSQIPTMLVSKLAKNHVTVALSGDGGDELFCGYSRYDDVLKFERYRNLSRLLVYADRNIPFKHALNKINRKFTKLFYLDSKEAIINNLYHNSGFYLSKALKKEKFYLSERHKDILSLTDNLQEAYMLHDMVTYLPDDILTKVDRATMSVSLEGREPLLDYRLFEYSFSLPHHFKYRKGNKKYILKQLTHSYIPEPIMNRPKMGFGLPLYEWLRSDLNYLLNELLSDEFILNQNIFSLKEVKKLRKNFEKDNSEFFARLIWHMLVFQMWHKKYM